MSRYCVIRTCKEQAGLSVLKGEKTRSHKFPRDESLKAQWELFVNQANHTTNFKATSHVVCSRHFARSCYSEKGRIQQEAVPTVADKFTLEVALKYHLVPPGLVTSEDLAQVNNYSNTIVQLREIEGDTDVTQPATVTVQGVPSSGCCDHTDVLIGCDDNPLGDNHHRSNSDVTPGQMPNRCLYLLVPSSEQCRIPFERTSESIPKREKRRHYPGDLTPSDFESPHQRIHNLNILKRELSETKHRLRLTQQRYRRAMKKLHSLEEHVIRLKKECHCS